VHLTVQLYSNGWHHPRSDRGTDW